MSHVGAVDKPPQSTECTECLVELQVRAITKEFLVHSSASPFWKGTNDALYRHMECVNALFKLVAKCHGQLGAVGGGGTHTADWADLNFLLTTAKHCDWTRYYWGPKVNCSPFGCMPTTQTSVRPMVRYMSWEACPLAMETLTGTHLHIFSTRLLKEGSLGFLNCQELLQTSIFKEVTVED